MGGGGGVGEKIYFRARKTSVLNSFGNSAPRCIFLKAETIFISSSVSELRGWTLLLIFFI